MDISKMSDELLQTSFEEAFEEQVGSVNDIQEFEAKVERSLADSDVKIELTIVGLAGTPTVDDFNNKTVENADRVTIKDDEDDENGVTFDLVTDEIIYLNGTDYVLVYEMSQ